MASGTIKGRLTTLAFVAVLVGLVYVGLSAFRAGPPPGITLEHALPAIGQHTPFRVVVEEPKRGLTRVRIEVVQGERVGLLEVREYEPRPAWKFWGDRQASDELNLTVGRETVEGLKEGKATVRVTADRASSWLRYPEPAVRSVELEVRLRPPQLQVLSTHTYVSQGGCEVVVYRVGATSIRDGVQAGDWFFPGYPLPGGGEQDRFALFSAPYDMTDGSAIKLVAADDVENEARTSFVDRFKAQPIKKDTIRLSDKFMERVIPAILSQTPEVQGSGDLLRDYLMINGELRKINSDTLIEISGRSVPEFLWHRRFMQMRNAQVMSTFADRRTYTYNGEAVDQQDHLGFDLASTRQAEIQAANTGNVMLARYFGIYGNAVIIDHGYGLLSLYGHLSEISVEEGETVDRGHVVGRSGQTGLAGGDHLHFTMLLQGLPVNSQEWWDGHWIRDRLKLKLGDALTFDE